MTTTATPARTYWAGNGRCQADYDRLYKLVPTEGPAPTPPGEIIRCLTNVYYDVHNNAGCNLHLPHLAAQWEYLRDWSGALGKTHAPPEFFAIDAMFSRYRGEYLPDGEFDGGDEDGEATYPPAVFPLADFEAVADAFIRLAVKVEPARRRKLVASELARIRAVRAKRKAR